MKRYWFVFAQYQKNGIVGNISISCETEGSTHLNQKDIQKAINRERPEYEIDGIVVSNFIEFKNEQDYLDWISNNEHQQLIQKYKDENRTNI